ncbi:hypothetical protein TNCV_5138011 [Trichonephila clavipes]|nr:hypothetical protein TNCV_5138011 [Trichonephila clavipes]
MPIGERPLNSEPGPFDEDHTKGGITSPKLHAIPTGGCVNFEIFNVHQFLLYGDPVVVYHASTSQVRGSDLGLRQHLIGVGGARSTQPIIPSVG